MAEGDCVALPPAASASNTILIGGITAGVVIFILIIVGIVMYLTGRCCKSASMSIDRLLGNDPTYMTIIPNGGSSTFGRFTDLSPSGKFQDESQDDAPPALPGIRHNKLRGLGQNGLSQINSVFIVYQL